LIPHGRVGWLMGWLELGSQRTWQVLMKTG
jgi:hypothetical protein